MNEGLRCELLAMAAEDQAVRSSLAADGSLFDGYHAEMQAVHDGNATRLVEIIDRHGWPGRSLVGEDGSQSAWLILQHAIAHPGLMRRCLPLLQDSAKRGDVSTLEVAMLEDRICVFEGKPQRYGTQYDWDQNGQLNPHPVEDLKLVDERRTALGLPSLDENTRRMRENIARDGEVRPQDWAARHQKFLNWARSVGWRG